MGKILTSILVGSHFHPPAKAILEHLPQGASLVLKHEADNPYDENAVQVLCAASEIPESQYPELDVKLPGMGEDLQEILRREEPLVLGHVAASGGKPLGKALLVRPDLTGNLEFLRAGLEGKATLAFDGSGLVLVCLEVEDEL